MNTSQAPIATEVRDFLRSSGLRAADLARESGVSNAIISHIVTGRRKDMRSEYADALREAMRRIMRRVREEAPHA